MITKLLLTLTVIAIAWLVVKNRQQRVLDVSNDKPPALVTQRRPNILLRWGGYALLAVMLLGSTLYLVMQWQEMIRVVTVRVIDTQTGRSVSYQARRTDVEDRHFITVDGREVNVANSERIELESAPARNP
ncbi:MAG: antitermination protein NusG [Candidatus Thiodiazotropha sp. (ex Lucinoma annulata)]|nr:antitermination protein NusG [Candidatus Thiodiazotropha sp. (ex Troendleina suluensis)]MCU7858183.1 antitermination protein NusG [Candidatus Thiodiazotropha sp. (ex Lucinoma borealis)]MCU7863861.1 antitermination protein NusG [Candidatus Thiodiazotropha sp. (ex Lucinoma borealis)]MCU7882730.1 antitermination protein NusG [Candidatus Thiodiazotropha sp. (ex Lucinoma annulata)]